MREWQRIGASGGSLSSRAARALESPWVMAGAGLNQAVSQRRRAGSCDRVHVDAGQRGREPAAGGIERLQRRWVIQADPLGARYPAIDDQADPADRAAPCRAGDGFILEQAAFARDGLQVPTGLLQEVARVVGLADVGGDGVLEMLLIVGQVVAV